MDIDLESISPVGLYSRARESTIDQEHALVDAIGCKISSSDGKVIGSDNTGHRWVYVGISVGRGVSPPREASRQRLRVRELRRPKNRETVLLTLLVKKLGKVGAESVPKMD